MFRRCVVPGIAAVTAGCDTMYFRNTCAQLRGVELGRPVGQRPSLHPANIAAAPCPRPPNGTLISTPIFRSCASASTLSAALRFPIE